MEASGTGLFSVALGQDIFASLIEPLDLGNSAALVGVIDALRATRRDTGGSSGSGIELLPTADLEPKGSSEADPFSPSASPTALSDSSLFTEPASSSLAASSLVDPVTGVTQSAALVGAGNIQLKTPNSGIVQDRIVFSTVNEEVRGSKTLTIRNTGDGPLRITALSIGNSRENIAVRDADNLRDEDFRLVNAPTGPFTIAAGGSRKVSVEFAPERVASLSAGDSPTHTINSESYASLAITSDDPDQGTVRINLAGLNSANYEGNNEPSVAEIARTFGFTFDVGTENNILGGSKTLLGDEVYSPYWLRADTTQPVELWPLAVYSGRGDTPHDSIKFEAKPGSGGSSGTVYTLAGRNEDDSPTGTEVQGSNDLSGGENQKLLPKVLVGGVNRVPTSSNVDFSPTSAFALNRNGAYTDDSRNGQGDLHNWRIYPVGNPDTTTTWFAAVDPGNTEGFPKNYDYNDDAYLLVNAKPEAPQNSALYRLDSGSDSSYTDTSGRVWSSDSGLFSPSDVRAETRGVGSNVRNTQDDTLYRSYRGFMGFNTPQADRSFTYNLPISQPQKVDVYLHFAEMFWTAPAKREFDVFAEGTRVLNDYDIFAEAGGALTKVEEAIKGVQVSDGTLNLQFKAEKDFAAIAAIAVLPSP